MFRLNLNLAVILSLLFQVSYGQRRIVNGENVNEPKRYVVYLVEARISPVDYDEWLCGGALVTPEFIITSAACVEDVKHLYAIAGYNQYVSKEELYKNPCTSKMKKKIIFTCVPKSYELEYGKLEKWAFIDIAVAKVESPYVMDDKEYETLCSYTPKPININFETKYQVEGIDAIALGWGHSVKWRSEDDTNTYNNVMLQYSPILIADKEKCKQHYQNYKEMNKVIDTYMICSIEAGNIDSKGALRFKSKPIANGCPGYENKSEQLLMLNAKPNLIKLFKHDCTVSAQCGTRLKLNSSNMELVQHEIRPKWPEGVLEGAQIIELKKECDPATEVDDLSWAANARRNEENNTINNNGKNINSSGTLEVNTDKTPINSAITRRNGICQNDHGGPIVTWIGSEEYLIAIASVFKVSKNFECTGPYLYTSTECNGAFLACVLGLEKNEERRRRMCDGSPAQKGFDTIETHISWRDHPDGLSANEKLNDYSKNKTSISNTTTHTESNIRTTNNKNVNVSATNIAMTTESASKSSQNIETRQTGNKQVTAASINITTILSTRL